MNFKSFPKQEQPSEETRLEQLKREDMDIKVSQYEDLLEGAALKFGLDEGASLEDIKNKFNKDSALMNEANEDKREAMAVRLGLDKDAEWSEVYGKEVTMLNQLEKIEEAKNKK